MAKQGHHQHLIEEDEIESAFSMASSEGLFRLNLEDTQQGVLKTPIHQQPSPPQKNIIGSHVLWISLITLTTTGILWLLGHDLGLGKQEGLGLVTDNFSVLRGCLLLLAAILGYYVLYGRGITGFLKQLTFSVPTLWVLLSLILGIAMGALLAPINPWRYDFTPWAAIGIIGAIMADRLYFSGFVANELQRVMPTSYVSPLINAVLFSLYSLSFMSVFNNQIATVGIIVLKVFIGIGVPTAFIQFLTGSCILPFLYQLAFVSSAFLMVHLGSGSWLQSVW